MKVLICVRRLDKGGAEMLESRLATQLNKLGIETHIAAQYDKRQFEGNERKKYWLASGVPEVHFLNSNYRAGLVIAFLKILILQYRNKYDIIITSNSGLDILISLAKMILPFKHVACFHTYLNNSILRKPRIITWKYLIKKADGYYSITDYVNADVTKKLGLNPLKNKTIYNSIALKSFVQSENLIYSIKEEYGLDKNCKIILMAGRIEANKGFDLSIEFLADLVKRQNVYMLIVGDIYRGKAIGNGRVGFHEELSKKIKSLNLEKKIIFAGYRNNLDQFMREADVFVHLARHEGFGLVLLEAIASGLPVVASNKGGIPEALKETPYEVFDLNNPQGIFNEVEKWIMTEENKKHQTTEEAKKALSFYTDERRAKEIKTFLETFIE